MKKKSLRIGGATVLVLGGTAGVASAQYQTTNFVTSNIGSAPSDFVDNVQFGAYGTKSPAIEPVFNTGSVTLAGSGYSDAALALIDSDGTSSGGGALGMYGNTDATLNFTFLSGTSNGNVQFGMAERINGAGGNVFGHGSSAPLVSGNYNNYPVYYCNYANGKLTLMQQGGYAGGGLPGTQLAQQTGISLAGGADTYQLEMSTQGGATPTITVTLTQNGTSVAALSTTGSVAGSYYGCASAPDLQGEVGFYGGSNNWSGTPYGIQATSFSVNPAAAHSALLTITANATSIGGYAQYLGTQNPGGTSGGNITMAGAAGVYAPGALNTITSNGTKGYAIINGFANGDQQIVAAAIQVTDAGNASFHDLAGNATELADLITDLQASPALSGVSGLTVESFAALQNTNAAAANLLAEQNSNNGGNPLDIAFLFTGSTPANPEALGLDLNSESVDGITAAEVTDIVVVPEPASMGLLLLGGLPLLAGRRRTRQTA